MATPCVAQSSARAKTCRKPWRLLLTESKVTIELQPMEAINDVFARLKNSKVNGRVALDISGRQSRN